MNKINFSFFYSRGGSGYVRGKQMAQYLGGKENPTSGFEDDLCIYVKIIPPDNHPKHSYLDVDDAPKAVQHLLSHPELGVIAISETAKDFLCKYLNRNDVVFIPHQHCNFERRIRPPKREVKTVGIIGGTSSFQYPTDTFRKELAKIGLELKYEQDYWNTYKSTEEMEMRLKVANFYNTLDIQVAWRPKKLGYITENLRNPNKLGNSSSFGIPMVAYPEPSYEREWGGCFVPANTIEEMLAQIKRLKDDPAFYRNIAQKALTKAEDYHIDNVAKLYLNLK